MRSAIGGRNWKLYLSCLLNFYQEREAAYEKEVEAKRIEKEREVARLRALQERARDEQAERDALRAKRAQEQVSQDHAVCLIHYSAFSAAKAM